MSRYDYCRNRLKLTGSLTTRNWATGGSLEIEGIWAVCGGEADEGCGYIQYLGVSPDIDDVIAVQKSHDELPRQWTDKRIYEPELEPGADCSPA